MTTQSTGEAMELLESKRGHLIAKGRFIAGQICLRKGTTTSREVLEEMEKLDLIPPDGKHFWVGAIFNQQKCFCWTGEVVSYSNRERNIHERTIKVWKLVGPTPGDPGTSQKYPQAKKQLSLDYADSMLPV